MAHITGGGFTENIPRVLPKVLAAEIDLDAVSLPPVFEWLRETGSIAEDEMLKTFNCGIGMVCVIDPPKLDDVLACLAANGEQARAIGRLGERTGNAVVYQGKLSAGAI